MRRWFPWLLLAAFVIGLGVWLCRGSLWGVPEPALRALKAQGYTNVEVIEQTGFLVGGRGCRMADALRVTVTAIDPNGKAGKFIVCTGLIYDKNEDITPAK